MKHRTVLTNRQHLGRRSEEAAVRFLHANGYTIAERNVRFPVGELDVVAWEGETLCFVEVRSASSAQWGGALASVTRPKQQRLIRAAQWYLARRKALPPQVRFDVVAIDWERTPPAVELVRGAFGATGHAW